MATETPRPTDVREYVVQMRGPITIGELQQALEDVESDVEVRSFQIGFTVDRETPVSLLPQGVEGDVKTLKEPPAKGEEPGEEELEDVEIEDTSKEIPESPTPDDLDFDQLDQYEYQTLQKAAASVGIKGNQKRDELERELRSHVGETVPGPSLPLRPGHDPFYLMRVIQDAGGWVLTDEIREGIQSGWGVNEDTIVTTLWQLTDRGLVEKRQYDEDKRKNEYRVTDEGEEVIEKAITYAEEEGIEEAVPA